MSQKRLIGGKNKDNANETTLHVKTCPFAAGGSLDALPVVPVYWDAANLVYEYAQQPVLEGETIVVENANVEQYLLDQLVQYKMSDWDDTSDPQYVGYLDKGGKYIIERYNNANSTVRYSAGTANYANAWTNRANESYNLFNVEM